MGLVKVLSYKFKPQHNRPILSFKYCKLFRKQSESTEEWISILIIKANDCGYKEKERKLKNNS